MKVKEIAQLIQAEVIGDDSAEISSLGGLTEAAQDQISFAVDLKHTKVLAQSKACAVIVPERIDDEPKIQLVVKSVEKAVAQLLAHWAPKPDRPDKGIHPTAQVDPKAQIDPSAAVGPNVVIGPRTKIASGVIIHPNVVIGSDVTIESAAEVFPGAVIHQRCTIGKRVIIGSNCVIGFDGFGYYFADGVHNKYPHIGTVIIEDDVELGACTCIDRGKMAETRIGAGSKIDNLVQVAHNVKMGKGCIMCGQVGIAGSAKLGNYVVAGGSAVFRDGITVADQTQVSGCAAVVNDIKSGGMIAGVPAKPAREFFREYQSVEKLPELLKEFKKLKSRIEKLETQNDQ